MSYVGRVLELMTDPEKKNALEYKDRCFRLSGEIMTVPQSNEEADYMDKVLWEYMMRKANNDINLLIKTNNETKNKAVEIHANLCSQRNANRQDDDDSQGEKIRVVRQPLSVQAAYIR